MPQNLERKVRSRLLAIDSARNKYLELDDYYYYNICPHAALKNKPSMVYFNERFQRGTKLFDTRMPESHTKQKSLICIEPVQSTWEACKGMKMSLMQDLIVYSENLTFMQTLPSSTFRLIYIDPPFNTGKNQKRLRLSVKASRDGVRSGFGERKYLVEAKESPAYEDFFEDYLDFLRPRLKEAHRLLTPDGSLFVHLDYREVHYVKALLDSIFGRECFMNEIIWAYDYGGRSKRRWPCKHDNILWFVKDPDNYVFNYEEIERIPYMAPNLVGEKKAKRGKTPTDVWWMTIVPTNSKEKTGYPTQKPLKLLLRIVRVHSKPGDWVLDFFAGSGTTGEACARLGRHFVLIDNHPDAIRIMAQRLLFARPEIVRINADFT